MLEQKPNHFRIFSLMLAIMMISSSFAFYSLANDAAATAISGSSVVPSAVFTPADITVAERDVYADYGIVTDENTGISCRHFQVDGTFTSGANTHLNLKLSASAYPESFKLGENKYMKIAYRSNISYKHFNFDIVPYNNISHEAPYLWYGTYLYNNLQPKYDGSVETFILDMSQDTDSNRFDLFAESYVELLSLKPHWGGGVAMNQGEYFDIFYVAFFATEEAAESYNHFERTVTYKNGDEIVATQKYTQGDVLAYPDEYQTPTRNGYTFVGWDTAAGTVIKEDITVNASFALFMPLDKVTVTPNGGWKAPTDEFDTEIGVYKHFGYLYPDTGKTNGGTNIGFSFENTLYPEDFKLSDYKYISFGIRSNVEGKNKSFKIDTMPDTGKSIWYDTQCAEKSQRCDETWEKFIVDLSYDLAATYPDAGLDTFNDNSDGTMSAVWLKPHFTDNITVYPNDYLDLSYIAFFDSSVTAEAYVYTPEKHTVTFVINGEYFDAQTYIHGQPLKYPNKTPENSGYQSFVGWDVQSDTPVTEDITVHAKYATVIPAKDLGHTALRGWKHDASSTSYLRFVTDPTDGYLSGASAGDQTRGEYTGEFSRIYLNFAKDMFSEDFTMLKHKYIKVGYRGNIPGNTWNFTNFNPMPYDEDGKEIRLWGAADPSVTYNGKWQYLISDISANDGGENIKTAESKSVFEANCDTWLSKLCLKPQFASIKMSGEEYFDILYVAFFDSEADAEAYEFAAPSEYTVNVKVGAEGTADRSGALSVTEGDNLTLTATPGTGYKMDGWYDITNGQNRLLTHDATVTLENITSNRDIEVRFYAESVGAVKKLIVLADDTGIGKIIIDGQQYDWYDGYRSDRSEVTITATPKDSENYFTAFWWRLSSDEKVISYLTYGETLEAMPLGAGVWYQPVYGKKGETVRLYVDSANVLVKLIGDVGDNGKDTAVPDVPARDGYSSDGAEWECVVDKGGFKLYKPKYASKENNEATLTIVWADGKREPVNNVPYDSQVTFSGHDNFHHWNIKVGDGEEYVLSYDRNYNYYHVFDENVVITEVLNDDSEKASLAHTLDARIKDNRIEFAAAIAFDSTKYVLVERGVLLSDTISDPGKLQLSTAGVIEGKIDESTTDFTGIYLVAKSKVKSGDTWYGRAYMIVKDKDTEKLETVYAAKILDFEV